MPALLKPGLLSGWWVKPVEALVLAVAVCFSLGAANSGSRLSNLDHRLMCMCGCAQLLGECDHVGCPDRGQETADLEQQIAAGMTDQQILDWFAAKYGETVLAAPPARGFDLVAWIAPFAVFGAALLGTILLIRRWASVSGGKMQPVAVLNPAQMDAPARARLEKIRRETGDEGGL
ncbi:MAG TPA: cytochrome c-type biogenesis protein CcmH [Terracidiphilus sp.]|nr:cytochrome c-type biogenesis protein CcmH [Terracidiphilus sp.]